MEFLTFLGVEPGFVVGGVVVVIVNYKQRDLLAALFNNQQNISCHATRLPLRLERVIWPAVATAMTILFLSLSLSMYIYIYILSIYILSLYTYISIYLCVYLSTYL